MRNPNKRLVGAWVNKDLLKVLMKNKVNVSEVIRQALEAKAKTLVAIALLVLTSACAPSPEQLAPLGPMRYIDGTWENKITGETLDLTDIAPYNDGYAVLQTKHFECSTIVYFKGDGRNGWIHVWTPAQVYVSPVTASAPQCEFLKTLTSYSIVGQTLTIKFDSDSQVKTFTWKN